MGSGNQTNLIAFALALALAFGVSLSGVVLADEMPLDEIVVEPMSAPNSCEHVQFVDCSPLSG